MKFKKTILSFIVMAVAVGCVYAWLKTRPERIFIRYGSGDHYYRVEVPQEIVKSKDCKKYEEWAHKSTDGAVFFAARKCPFRDPPKSNIAKFTINGITLSIPREYLRVAIRGDHDEEKNKIWFEAYWPSMEPTTQTVTRTEVRFDLIDKKYQMPNIIPPEKAANLDMAQAKYEFKNGLIPEDVKLENQPYYKLRHKNPRYGMYEYFWYERDYKNPSTYVKSGGAFFIKGNPRYPENWIECSVPEVDPNKLDLLWCESFFNHKFLGKEFLVSYHFNKSFMPEHNKIRQAVIDKINEFIKDDQIH